MVSRTGEQLDVAAADGIGATVASAWRSLKVLVREATLLVLGLGWIAGWGAVIRLNVATGNRAGAAVVGLVFVLPAVALLLWRLGVAAGLVESPAGEPAR